MTGSPGRPRQVSDQQVFDALIDLINDDGPAKITLERLAQRLGVTGPALGYRYKNRQGLLAAFAAAQPAVTSDHLAKVAATAPTPRSAIVEALVGMVSTMTTRRHVGNNVAMLHLDLTDDELHGHAHAQATSMLAFVDTQLARAGVTDSERRSELAREVYIAWNGAITSWAIIGTGALAEWTAHHIERVLDRELPTNTTTS